MMPFSMIYGFYTREAAAAATRAMFAGSDVPDAVFVSNDHMAFAVIEVLQGELGLNIPEDVSVVGYDDVAMAAWPSFSLTTVHQPANRMVDAVVGQLIKQIGAPYSETAKIEIDGPLVIRSSAKQPKGWTL